MSIETEVSRLSTAKAAIKTSINGKGVPVPSDARLDTYPEFIDAIESGYILPTMSADIKGGAAVGAGLGMTGEALGIRDKGISNAMLGDAAVDHRALGQGSVQNDSIAAGAVFGDKLKPPAETALGGVKAKVGITAEPFLNIIADADGELFAVGADAIEHQGTSGIWKYIKYKSGLAVCWGTGEAIICGATVAWGSGWETDKQAPIRAFPFEFTEVYANLGELSCIGGHMLTVRIAEGQSVSAPPQTTSGLYGFRPTSTAKITLLPYYLVVGRWK